jgi:uncharacterized protein YbjQ (UPF0145 family)
MIITTTENINGKKMEFVAPIFTSIAITKNLSEPLMENFKKAFKNILTLGPSIMTSSPEEVLVNQEDKNKEKTQEVETPAEPVNIESEGIKELPVRTGLLNKACEICIERLSEKGEKLGADAIVGVKLSFSEAMMTACEIIVIGTAVKFID